ncbi:MAG: 3-isopropylmalate dehydratase small subunit [Candidatus Omnitrophica bacterium]|nr:3-isopropylmalate dehydratase small subunit [Candidatus Omnitrophota bacterium]MCG2704112.1 3-isopropylmalate dehydratase small subunit [Candidatus Omnitrophota bacterium]
MKIQGKTWRFGDNINTDEIIAARYLNTFDAQELGSHCMEDIDKNFSQKIAPGDIIVAGKNFGCGSSREHAPIAIKGCGISGVVAESFARIFYRNAVNIGLPIFVSAEAAESIKEGDLIEIDAQSGVICNRTQSKNYQTDKFAGFMQDIVNEGGLLNWIKKKGIK